LATDRLKIEIFFIRQETTQKDFLYSPPGISPIIKLELTDFKSPSGMMTSQAFETTSFFQNLSLLQHFPPI